MADKTRSIKNASDVELDELLIRLEKERRVQSLIGELQRIGSKDVKLYEDVKVSTEQPIESLYHYGIPGMHWGKRGGQANKSGGNIQAAKSHVASWLKEAGKMTLNSYTHPILTNKANRASIASDGLKDRLRRTMVYQNTKDIKDINQRVAALLAEKKK